MRSLDQTYSVVVSRCAVDEDIQPGREFPDQQILTHMRWKPHPFHARTFDGKAGGEVDGAGSLRSAAVGVVSARHQQFSGDVLLIDAEGAEAATSGAVLLRATAGGQDVFEIKVGVGVWKGLGLTLLLSLLSPTTIHPRTELFLLPHLSTSFVHVSTPPPLSTFLPCSDLDTCSRCMY